MKSEADVLCGCFTLFVWLHHLGVVKNNHDVWGLCTLSTPTSCYSWHLATSSIGHLVSIYSPFFRHRMQSFAMWHGVFCRIVDPSTIEVEGCSGEPSLDDSLLQSLDSAPWNSDPITGLPHVWITTANVPITFQRGDLYKHPIIDHVNCFCHCGWLAIPI